ncbi:hypothetical protein K4L06_20550 [Lysobacter sp. BMK333-48F3]|uniref:DUF5694 domain-containing protein n=1 Tax=Lysobacter sp. BMK333-48F3 TaxID=2867962 RepID=UPI001C8C99D4|nr:DUF5694 domain-containing protein [Lysobacter sp. BMK333-48F3]MBX9403704.1 hypothetical protein [Lysobacter sp. BMK333-48F3]
MSKQWAVWALGWALAAGTAQAQQVDLSALDKNMHGRPAQVLVLGTVHLSDMPKTFDAKTLAPLLDRVAAFEPEIITIESISGESCDLVARHPAVYSADDFKPYCRDTSDARAATGLDVPAAIAEANRTLKQWPAQPSAAQRRRLAAVFLAAGDSTSALVQWLYLPVAERRDGDGLDAKLVARLEKARAGRSENELIAAPLAVRAGLQRVHPTDDHTGDAVDVSDPQAYGQAIMAAWASAKEASKTVRERDDALRQGQDMLALYRYINRPDVLGVVADGDFGAAMREASPQRLAQVYVAGWETRNLRMVGNIRASFRERPGARVLSIVGSQHKPWFDSLLGQMQGVQIVDLQQVLK